MPRRGEESDAPAEEEDDRLPGLPRYLRINTLKIGKKAVNKQLALTGHHHCPDPTHPGNRAFYHDDVVPDLLVFKPKGQSDVSRIAMVKSGELVIQQKASCFPAVALAPPPGATVIDACAAPGNKTSHVAAILQNRGKVIAFEVNKRRCELLEQMMRTKGASCVECVHGSFLDADPADAHFAHVTHIMLDPSCSSSGMSRTPLSDPKALQELADEQVREPARRCVVSFFSLLPHAALRASLLSSLLPMGTLGAHLACPAHRRSRSSFTRCASRRCAWSATVRARLTRSRTSRCGADGCPLSALHVLLVTLYRHARPIAIAPQPANHVRSKIANRAQVVRRVLAASGISGDFALTTALPWWERRGHVLTGGDHAQAELIARSVVRSSYPEDETIGFFLAKFVRGPEPEPGGEFRMKLQALAQARASKGGKHAGKHAGMHAGKHAGKKRAHSVQAKSATEPPIAKRDDGDRRPKKKARAAADRGAVQP